MNRNTIFGSESDIWRYILQIATIIYIWAAMSLSSSLLEAQTLITSITFPGSPSSIAINSDGSRAFVADLDGAVRVIDVATNTLSTTIEDARFFSLNTLAITPDGSQIYVLGCGDFAIDTATFAVSALPTVGDCHGSLAITPNGMKVYAQKGPTIFVLNPTNNSIITIITLPHDPLA
jgi:DNA-binding beta-propeller fold protein YncE